MKKFTKAILYAALSLLLFLPSFGSYTAEATATGYDSASDVVYQKTENYIHNWGVREEDCTFLSPNAEAFYTGSNNYASLSANSGGSSQSNAPSSNLYKALQSLMKSQHSHQTSYGETRYQYRYTDCENNDSSTISSFYSGTSLSGNWDSGATWNREHTWPNSKGLGGDDENDIMMLRPTSTSENSSRGNTAYGKSGSYYNPNSEANGKYDLRGDCARIVLYVYVRWGNTSKMWGTRGVMESLTVLLEWMEADPVDTWEMGRNDSVQSITGTRNVFVDYPEFAWLLFGEAIPSNLKTPSGEGNAKQECRHEYSKWIVTSEPTAWKDGERMRTCYRCGNSESEILPKTGNGTKTAIIVGCSVGGVALVGATVTVIIFLKKKKAK